MVQTQRSTAASTASLLPATKWDEQPDTVEVEPVERNERVERVVIGTTGPLGKLHWKPQIHMRFKCSLSESKCLELGQSNYCNHSLCRRASDMVQTQRSTAASTASLLPATKWDEQPDTVEVEPVERNERVERVVIGTTGPLGKLHWKPQIHRMLTGFVIFYMALLLIWFGVFINRDRLSFLTDMDEKAVYNVVTLVCLTYSLWALYTKNAYRLGAAATFMRVDGLHHLLMAVRAAFSFIHRGYLLGMDNNLDVIVGCVISTAFCAVEFGLVAPAFDKAAKKERARLPVVM